MKRAHGRRTGRRDAGSMPASRCAQTGQQAADGVALAAIQGQNSKLDEQAAANHAKDREIADLPTQLVALKTRIELLFRVARTP